MQTALTPRQAAFVDQYVICGNAAEAARRAGYSPNGAKVAGCRLLTKINLQAAISAKKQALAVETEIRKEHVIAAVLDAIRMAKEQGAPSVMIRGWMAVAKMCGLDDPAAHQAAQESLNSDGSKNLRFMPTAELYKLLSQDDRFRNDDGSAMSPAQIDGFYQALTNEELKALSEGRARVVTKVEIFASGS